MYRLLILKRNFQFNVNKSIVINLSDHHVFHLTPAQKMQIHCTNIPAKVRGDDARVEAVGGDVGAAQTVAQLSAEEEVGQLRLQAKD